MFSQLLASVFLFHEPLYAGLSLMADDDDQFLFGQGKKKEIIGVNLIFNFIR